MMRPCRDNPGASVLSAHASAYALPWCPRDRGCLRSGGVFILSPTPSKSSRLTFLGYAPEPQLEPLRGKRGNVRLRPAGSACERGCRGGSPYRLMPGLPARAGEPPAGGRSVRLLAHRCAASAYIAAG